MLDKNEVFKSINGEMKNHKQRESKSVGLNLNLKEDASMHNNFFSKHPEYLHISDNFQFIQEKIGLEVPPKKETTGAQMRGITMMQSLVKSMTCNDEAMIQRITDLNHPDTVKVTLRDIQRREYYPYYNPFRLNHITVTNQDKSLYSNSQRKRSTRVSRTQT